MRFGSWNGIYLIVKSVWDKNKRFKVECTHSFKFHSELVCACECVCQCVWSEQKSEISRSIKINPLTNFMVSSEMIAHTNA